MVMDPPSAIAVAAADPEVDRAWAVAAGVPDPEIPVVTLVDLGILRSVSRRDGTIVVALTPTYTGCPATLAIRMDVEAALLAAGLADIRVEIILSPAWSTDDITETGRRKLLAYGIAPPPSRDRAPVVACVRCGSTETTLISEFGSTPCKSLWRCEACREPFDVFKCL